MPKQSVGRVRAKTPERMLRRRRHKASGIPAFPLFRAMISGISDMLVLVQGD
jgi:hypothetical protein